MIGLIAVILLIAVTIVAPMAALHGPCERCKHNAAFHTRDAAGRPFCAACGAGDPCYLAAPERGR